MKDNIVINEHVFSELFSAEELDEICSKLSGQLWNDYKCKDVVFLVVLNGAYVFATDLLRKFPKPVNIQTIKVSSYSGMERGELVFEVLPKNLSGKNVVVIEDILDTGATMKGILDYLDKQEVNSVEVCTLFLKPNSFKGEYPVRYVGKEIGDEFIVGYGFDIDGFGRNLPCVYQKL